MAEIDDVLEALSKWPHQYTPPHHPILYINEFEYKALEDAGHDMTHYEIIKPWSDYD